MKKDLGCDSVMNSSFCIYAQGLLIANIDSSGGAGEVWGDLCEEVPPKVALQPLPTTMLARLTVTSISSSFCIYAQRLLVVNIDSSGRAGEVWGDLCEDVPPKVALQALTITMIARLTVTSLSSVNTLVGLIIGVEEEGCSETKENGGVRPRGVIPWVSPKKKAGLTSQWLHSRKLKLRVSHLGCLSPV